MHATLIHRLALPLLTLLAVAGRVSAQRVPDLGYCFPPGGRAGTTVEVRLGGYDWTPDMQFFVLDRRVQLVATGPPGELLIPPPPYWFGPKSKIPALPVPREVPARFVIPADVPPGPIRWQAANANGATATGLFIVSAGPEVVEDERRKAPQPLPSLPVTVSGRISKIEEIDRYRFAVPKTGPVTCELMARRLGANFHAILEVRDMAGRLVADAADSEGLDSALLFTARAGVEYIVSVRDVDFGGDRSFVYRLSFTPGPRVQAAIPAAGRRGETRAVEFVGLGMATGEPKLESVTRQVTFPKEASVSTLAYTLETPFGTSPAFPLLVSDLTESITPPRTAEKLYQLRGPVAVTGVLDQPDAEDRYAWHAKKGEMWTLAVEARRIGSPLDVALTILGPDGKELARNDDLPGTTDAGLSFTVPADGTYQVVVSDQAGKAGSRAAVYRLVLQQPASDFTLEVAQQRVSVPIGGKVDLAVKATRHGGLQGPIALAMTGLPPGVSVPAALVIPADKSDLIVPLVSARDAPATASLVTVTGTARVGTATVTRTALAPSPGNLVPRSPDENHVAAIVVVSTIKPRCKGSPVDKDTGRKVHRGTTFPAEVVLERLEGFTGEILLQMAARQSYQVQGITGGEVTVPRGVTRTVYPCFMPEWLETSRTSRMAMIATVKVSDPRGNVRYLVNELEGMVTMSMEGAILKVSHEPREVTAQPGQTIALRVKIARSPELPEPVRLELRLPDELAGLLTAEAVTVPASQADAAFSIVAKNDPRLIGEQAIVIRATALQNGRLPVISETTVPVEFLSAAGKSGR
jgi:hypothetical protein